MITKCDISNFKNMIYGKNADSLSFPFLLILVLLLYEPIRNLVTEDIIFNQPIIHHEMVASIQIDFSMCFQK